MTRFWQYKAYADIRSGSQDLCKFSFDFEPAPTSRFSYTVPTYYTDMAVVVFKFKCLVYDSCHLATNRAA